MCHTNYLTILLGWNHKMIVHVNGLGFTFGNCQSSVSSHLHVLDPNIHKITQFLLNWSSKLQESNKRKKKNPLLHRSVCSQMPLLKSGPLNYMYSTWITYNFKMRTCTNCLYGVFYIKNVVLLEWESKQWITLFFQNKQWCTSPLKNAFKMF